jgi:EmrB/QacA subfamily drug resistance transporter
VWGRLSDLYGRRPLYLAGIVFFLLGSALSGASQSITQLIVFRAIQGFGAGALIPLSMTINGDIYTLSERARMQGLFSGVWGLASILGPLAGGFITDNLSWRWVFYINIPFGLAAAIIVGLALVEPKRDQAPTVDYAGATWLTLAVTLLLLALVESGDPRVWANPWMLVIVAGSIIFSVLFVRTEQRAREPIVPFSLFRNRVVAVGSITSFLVGAAMFGAISFIPLFIQGTMGGSATEAGILLTPFLLGWVVTAILGGRLIFQVGFRPTILAGLVILVISFGILSTFGQTTPRWELLADMAAMGAGMGLVTFGLLIIMQNAVERGLLGIATSLNQFARSIGQTVGVAIMGTVMTLSLAAHVSDIQRESGLPQEEVSAVAHNSGALIDPIAREQMKSEQPALLSAMKAALGDALRNVFLVGTGFAALALLSGLWIPAAQPREATAVGQKADKISSSPAECERLLMAEMTTIDAEHEPAAVE